MSNSKEDTRREELRKDILALRFGSMARPAYISKEGKRFELYSLNDIDTIQIMQLIDQYTQSLVDVAVAEADKTVTELIDERDKLENNLDSLSEAVAKYFNKEIGEQSSANSPWFNAFQMLRDATLQTTKEKANG